MKILKAFKKVIAVFTKSISIAIFFGILPALIIVCWLIYLIKKIFKQKPKINISFIGIPMAFLNCQAVNIVGYKADVYALSVDKVFNSLSFGLIISRNRALNLFLYLTDYLPLFFWAVLKYDIFESTFRGGILSYSFLLPLEPQLLKIMAKKVVFYGYGADCTVLADTRKLGRFNVAMDRNDQDDNLTRKNVARAKKFGDVLIGAGDLIYFGKKQIVVPLSVDLKKWPPLPQKKNKIVTIIHPTNHRSYKGTRFILRAIERLKKEKLPFEFLLIEGKPQAEARRIYQKGDIFVTDVIGGWHGLTAIEVMSMGRPVVSYLRPVFFKAHKYYAKDIPIINAVPTTLTSVLKKLIKDYEFRKKTGLAGGVYARKYHSLEYGGKMRAIIYQYLWENKKITQKIFERELIKRQLL